MMEDKQIDRRNRWQMEHQERIVIMTSRTDRPTKADIKAAAAAAGQSVNAWVLDLIRKELFG